MPRGVLAGYQSPYDATETIECHIMEDYEGPYGSFVGRRTPSINSRWSGSSRSLEDVEQQHQHQHYQHGSRTRQLSATQFPPSHYQQTSQHQQQQQLQQQQLCGSRTSLQSPPYYSATVGQSPVNLEEAKGMTSSAEELSTTLVSGYRYKEPVSSSSTKSSTSTFSESKFSQNLVTGMTTATPSGILQDTATCSQQTDWVPIDVPNRRDASPSVHIERPEPTRNGKSTKTKESKRKKGTTDIQAKKDLLSDDLMSSVAISPADIVDFESPSFSWSEIAKSGTSKNEAVSLESTDSDLPPLTLSLHQKPIDLNKKNRGTLSTLTSSGNTGTSDDDAYGATEVKKERKKKKRKDKTVPGSELSTSSITTVDDDSIMGFSTTTSSVTAVGSNSPKDEEQVTETKQVENWSSVCREIDIVEDLMLGINETDSTDAKDDNVSDEKSLVISLDHFDSTPEATEPATLAVESFIDENQYRLCPSTDNLFMRDCDDEEKLAPTRKGMQATKKKHSEKQYNLDYDEDGNYSHELPPNILESLDDFALHEDSENGNNKDADIGDLENTVQLSSAHSDNDLAKALEEACSDDDNAHRLKSFRSCTRTSSSNKGGNSRSARNQRVSELFPYRVSSSDDDDDKQWAADGSNTVRAKPTVAVSIKPTQQTDSMTLGVVGIRVDTIPDEEETVDINDTMRVGGESEGAALSVSTECAVATSLVTSSLMMGSSVDDVSTDDRGETTSGDDRRGTGSDSSLNVTAITATSKNKKKKKKRR